jgi:hypothetical protein
MKCQEVGENCTVMSFITCILKIYEYDEMGKVSSKNGRGKEWM